MKYVGSVVIGLIVGSIVGFMISPIWLPDSDNNPTSNLSGSEEPGNQVLGTSAIDKITFPFNKQPSISFLRQGDSNYEAGGFLTMDPVREYWEITIKDTTTDKVIRHEKITAEHATKILSAFSNLYNHWNSEPLTVSEKKRYSIVVHLDNFDWTTQISVRDTGSAELKQLLTLLDYPN